MDTSRFDGMTVTNAINLIKQKHFSDLDATDFAFLKAREDLLTDADKAIYLKGENPYEVVQDATPVTREERIINENRPLQDVQKKVSDQRNEASRILNAETVVEVINDEELAKERSKKAKSLVEEVKVTEKAEADAEKEEAARLAKEEKASK